MDDNTLKGLTLEIYLRIIFIMIMKPDAQTAPPDVQGDYRLCAKIEITKKALATANLSDGVVANYQRAAAAYMKIFFYAISQAC